MDARQQLAAALEEVLAGKRDLAKLLDGLPFSDVLDNCMHLWHFASDGDIREKDVTYRNMQEDEMRKLIKLLRSDVPINTLRQVHFLGPSEIQMPP
ncbi:hypothetical protein ACG04Q_02350 [Roseateles sp. DXS20W]|uniref:Uncharacterized protein n=1 Tax=Pelomonas lactea TaxID=3299030 RepID=A0ABW7GEW9_9BURK